MSVRAQLVRLLSHSAVYGAADVFPVAINFFLVPFYVRYLSAADYGTIALLAMFSTLLRQVLRLGLDSAFFRIHYDVPEGRQKELAGTAMAIAGGVATAVFALCVLCARLLADGVLEDAGAGRLLVLAAADVWLGAFTFVPQALLRIGERSAMFSALSMVRHATNIGLKVLFVRGGLGVTGVILSDVLSTLLFLLLLLPVLRGRIRRTVARDLARDLLGFGLPKVPHGLLVQAQNLLDRRILAVFVSLSEIGVYQMANTFGTGVKFAMSAFGPAWEPYVYASTKRAEGPRELTRIVTFVFAGFVFAGLGFALLGGDLLVLMTARNPEFARGAPLVPLITLAYLFHGAFLLGSVGIGIGKRASYYPAVTAAAATVNVLGNFVLIPRFGLAGAAWATVVSYAVMAVLGIVLGRRAFPLPYEWGRLAAVIACGVLAWVVGHHAPLPHLAAAVLALLLYPALTAALLWPRRPAAS